MAGNDTNTRTRQGFSYRRLYRVSGAANHSEFARSVGRSHRTVMRWKAADTIPYDSADEAAVNLGHHPANVWPEKW